MKKVKALKVNDLKTLATAVTNQLFNNYAGRRAQNLRAVRAELYESNLA